MIARWWQSLGSNERRMLGFGAPLAALALGWALIWHPLAQRRVELQADVQARSRDLAFVERGAQEIGRLRVAGQRSLADRAGRSLLALADASARGAGLGEAMQRVEPSGVRGVRLSFEGARFDALIGWIEELAQSYGVETVDLSVDRAEGIGLVNARVTLQDAPG